MGNYFYDMLTPQEREQLYYLPTVNDLLKKIAEYGDLEALCDSQTSLTYSQLCFNVGKCRSLLDEKCIPYGARVAVWDKNSIDSIELFLAIVTSGRTAIMLPQSLNDQAFSGITKKFGINTVFCGEEFMPLTKNADVSVYSVCEKGTSYISDNKTVNSSTLAAIFFTGGTTGTPKGAMLTHGALMRGSFNGIFMTGGVMYKRYYSMLPLSHIFGMVRGTLSCLYTGASVYICENMQAALRELPVVKPTTLVLVPGLVEILLSVAKVKGIEALGGKLETIICGAANVPSRLMKDFAEFGITLLAGYGLTETANLVSGNANTAEKPDSVGMLYPETQAKVVDGELWVKGDSLFSGYCGDEEATNACMVDGWFRTGDLVRFDEDGFMYITGRIKNLIVLSNGENVSPEAIEELFYKEPTVRDCLVSETKVNGKSVLGIEVIPLVPNLDAANDDELYELVKQTVDKVNSELPAFMQIRNIKLRKTDFPRTGNLKIARNAK